MTPRQQAALAEVLDPIRMMTDEERGRLVLLVMANNVKGLEAMLEEYLSDFTGTGPTLSMAGAAKRAQMILTGEEEVRS
jgi:hypothetical protein